MMDIERRRDPLRNPELRKRQGKLLLIGGAEDKTEGMDILRSLVTEAGGPAARIEVITTASSVPEETWDKYQQAFAKIGVAYAAHMNIGSRAEADSSALQERISAASAILFTGGDQLRITSILDGTPVAAAIRQHSFDENGLIAGTSAGAAALSGTIIYNGAAPHALRKGGVAMTGGLALISNTVVDTHFVARGRIGRLIQVVAGNPRLIGIGLGEDTGVLVSHGTSFNVVGSGLVIIVDGSKIGFTSVFDVEHMEPFSVENIRMHVLSTGAGYDLESRTFYPPPKQPLKPNQPDSA